jgi:hypothetical protein
MAKFRQLKRQRASDVGKPTGLGIGDRFGRNHEQIQRILSHGKPTRCITLWSGGHFKPGTKLILMLPTVSQCMELCRRQRFTIDKSLLEKHHQPPVIRIRQKQRIAGLNTDLPSSRRFSDSQSRPWNKRVVFHPKELHKLGMLIHWRPPCLHKRARGQPMEHQLVGSHMTRLFFQRRHPAATKSQPDSDQDKHTGPSHALQQIKTPSWLRTTPSRSKHAREISHKRRRLLGSTGFTGWQTSH